MALTFPSAAHLRRLAAVVAALVAAGGAALLSRAVLRPQAAPGSAAVALALCAGAASVTCGAAAERWRGFALARVALAAASVAVSAAVLVFQVQAVLTRPGPVPPGGPASGALLLLGLAALLLDSELPAGLRPAQLLALGAELVPLQSAVAWLYGIDPARGGALFPQVGPLMGLALAALGGAVLLARPEHGVVSLLTSTGPAGFTSRRLILATVALPVVLGWIFLVAGLHAGQYEALIGASLVVLSAVVTGSAVVWWNSREIQAVDEARTAVEETLRAEREWFRTTLESIGDAVIAADEGGRVVDLNPVAQALTGCRPDTALGRPIDEVFRIHGANRRPLESPFARVLRERRVAHLPRETVLVGRGGDELAVEGSAAPIRDRRGRPRGVVLVFRDMRERRRVEEERASLLVRERAARAEAEAASRAKDEFIATLSHELRTPLNSVLGWARLLRLGKLDGAGVARAVEAIERGATTQAQIVDDLLDMARIVRGQLRLEVRPIGLVPVIEAALDVVRPAATAREIALCAELDPDAGPVAGDAGRLQQVVWNLLTNAVKFTQSGGRVEVRLVRRAAEAELTVRDDGAGIPAELLPHVFERFRQGDSSITRSHGGLGLGLAIVRHLVEAHGGTVSAESGGPAKGSLFTVRLPLAPVQPRTERLAAAEGGARPAAGAPLRGLRVLVVDDDGDTRELVQRLLGQAGADVAVACSAAEALAAIGRAAPDVLISDIGMPGVDGYELLRQVRALPPEAGGAVPAAALSAFTRPEDAGRAREAGYQAHLVKPIDPLEITAAVARLARRAGAVAER